jgi:hypothetical protein|tara:strand:+ start:304 stop:549 length:246 start_codon:yes stop_codon:yes gene_type:complete
MRQKVSKLGYNSKKKGRKFRKVSKDKKTGVAKKYLSGAKNKAAKAREIKETAKRYKAGLPIDVKKISKSRTAQGKRKKKKS